MPAGMLLLPRLPSAEGSTKRLLSFVYYSWRQHALWINAPSSSILEPAGLVVEGYTPEQVEEVRMVVRLLPIFFTTILYWTVYAQMGTFFIMQARLCTLRYISRPPAAAATQYIHPHALVRSRGGRAVDTRWPVPALQLDLHMLGTWQMLCLC